MYRMRTWRLTLAVVFVAATILLAGGLAVGSNMGFKLNMRLVQLSPAGGQIGKNLVSFPYNNPYVNTGGICNQLGLPSVGGNTSTVAFRGPTGDFNTRTCSVDNPPGGPVGGIALSTIANGSSFQITVPGVAGNPTSAIIVGSHNPTLSITLPSTVGGAQNGNFWFSIPYHTTAVNANDICVQAGMVAANQGTIQSLDPVTGNTDTALCPSTNAANIALVLGRGIQLRYPAGPLSFIPAHF